MKTRTIPELLQVLLDNEKYFLSGLCLLISSITKRGKISACERVCLYKFLNENSPCDDYFFFWFPKGEWPPRKEWLEKQIESFKNIES